jgi:polyisoprenoid-binding protein YceI
LIENIDAIKTGENGTYTSNVTGKLTIKDVTKEVSAQGTFTVKNGVVNAKTTFVINPEDYNIEIPKTVAGKISKEIKITVDADYRHAH